MNEELNELIVSYEDEREELTKRLNECLEDFDYLGAHKFQKGIAIANHQLVILNSIKDPSYQKKTELENMIRYYDRLKTISPLISDYIDEQVAKTNVELNILSNQKVDPFYDGQEFDDAIFDLAYSKILSIVFHLKKSSNLYLKFKCKKNNFIISVTPDEQIGNEVYFPKDKKRLLKSLGFKRNKTKEYFHLKLSLIHFKDSQQVKTIVSRVIYDVFYRNELDTETTLVIQSIF
ncbi:hypothetical protein [Pedobacter sp. Leaf250]|uniref:hypothetical protein n=1 Tax=Pedobacter sp. Leaf250 TaxID=2876559 RepID=UPI001E4B9AF9|nr:hypothetical protein [Pedobacter sp. Leaf250]